MSQPLVQSYLFFSGRCNEALEFYRTALGAEIEMIMRFKDSPEPVPADQLAPGYEEKVMHSSFRIGKTILMASDGCGEAETFGGFSLSLAVTSAEEADRYFAALTEGGKICMSLDKTFWSPKFGIVQDRFGISWMVNVVPESEGQPQA